MADTPVVMLTGARQTGKTTLVLDWARHNRANYYTLDDVQTLAGADADPQGFILNLPLPAVIDEVQKVPRLLPAIKLRVDRDRHPGMFLLTGSANVLALPHVSESLAGRMEIHTLWPLSRGELSGRRENFLTAIFSEKQIPLPPVHRTSWPELLTKGGYPEATHRKSSRASEWFRSYLTAIIQRDIRDLSQIEGLTAIPNVLAVLATRAACLLNTSDLTRDCAVPNTTLKRYLSMLEMIFIIYRLPAWSVNLGKRLIKAPKIMFCDTGLACHLLGADANRLNTDGLLKGRLLENFVANELLKQATWQKNRIRLFHYRSASGQKIDLILEDQQGRIVALEVKASHTIQSTDFTPMRALKDSLKSRFLMGIILHDGNQVIPHGQCFYSAPITCLWSSDEK